MRQGLTLSIKHVPGEQREQNRHQRLGSLQLLLVLQQLQDQSDSLPRNSCALGIYFTVRRFPNQG